jgi:beta-galactosidase
MKTPLLSILAAAVDTVAWPLAAQSTPRERISLNADWRFQKGDPQGANSADLLYDVRPEPKAGDEQKRKSAAKRSV